MTFGTVLTQVIMIFLLMGVGVLSNKLHFVHAETAQDITKILIFIVSPCVIFKAFNRPFSSSSALALLLSFGCIVILFILSIVAARLVFHKRTEANADRKRMLEFGAVYSNCGFMGVPLLQAILGTQGIFYGTPYFAVFNLFCWTHGISLYEGRPDRGTVRKVLCNPNIIAIAAGLAVFLFSIKLPPLVTQGIGYLYDLNTPLSMIVIGNSLASLHPRTLFTDKSIWPGALMRNLAIPLATLALLRFSGLPQTVWMATLLLSACPVAGYCVLFAGVNAKDTVFPTKLVALSTLLSIVTIPLIVSLAAL